MIKRISSFSVACILLLASHAMHGQTGGDHAFLWTANGGMQDLGVPAGYVQSFANAISRTGQIAGYLLNASFETSAAVWTPQAGWRILSERLNPKYSIAYGINIVQQVVGVTYTPGTTTQHAFLWTAATGMQDLGTLGGATSQAYGINDSGEVVGVSLTATGDGHAFLWTQAGGMQDLGTLDAGGFTPGSAALAINDKGVIAGSSVPKDDFSEAVFWRNGHIYTLKGIGPPDPGQSGPSSIAYAINNVGPIGEIAGTFSKSSPNEPAFPFLWNQATGVITIGALDGSTSNTATGVNDLGQVVGYDFPSIGVQLAFIWSSADGLQSLGTLGGPDSWATAINDAGQVVGYSSTP
jgi:probable HAF family extracellular repeat protein